VHSLPIRSLGLVALALATAAITGCIDGDSSRVSSGGAGGGGSFGTPSGSGGSSSGGTGSGGSAGGGVVTITAVSPATVHTAGDSPITITGTGFITAGTVTVGGAALQQWTVLSATTIVGRAPTGTAGPAAVSVEPVAGRSATLAGAVTYGGGGVMPNPAQVAPGAGLSTGGSLLTITGTGFETGVSVAFGAVSVAPRRAGPTFIEVTVPAAPVVYPSVVDLVVVNPGGAAAVVANGFVWRDRPVSADVVTPAQGAAAMADVLPDVADDGQGGLHAAWEKQDLANGTVHVYYRRSFDGGRSWTIPVPISINGPAGRPRIAASGSVVAIVWEQRTATSSWNVRASVSLDRGWTWSVRPVLDSVTAPPGPATAVLANGTVAAVWASQTAANGGRVRCVTAPTATAGAVFGTPVSVATAVAPATPAVDGDGAATLLVAWSDPAAATGAQRDVFTARSIDGGGSFAQAVNVSVSAAAASTAPDVLLRGGDGCVVWQQATAAGGSEIQGAVSATGGVSFSTAPLPQSAAGGETRRDPVLAEAANGVWLLAYAGGTAAAAKRVWLHHSVDQGRHWGARADRSVTPSSDHPRLSSGARPFALWRDTKSGRPHCYGW
jgi:hypothetical protein